MTTTLSNLVPQKAVLYAANASSNSTNGTSGSKNGSSSSTSESGAISYVANPVSWKFGVAIGALVASPFVLSLGL